MNSKTRTRIGYVSNNALRQILVSAFGMVIPFLVIHYTSKAVWGGLVPALLFTLLCLQVVNWGNKEYLLRQFSRMPNRIAKDYTENLVTRLPLLAISCAVGFYWFGMLPGIFITLWILGRFFIHSTEPLIVYEKKFKASIAVETVCFVLFCVAFILMKSNMDAGLLILLYGLYQLLKGVVFLLLFRHFLCFEKTGGPKWGYYHSAFPFFLLSVLGFLASKVDVYIMTRFGGKSTMADYQIINSLLVFIMSLPAFIYAPFAKNIYRNTETVIDKTRKLLFVSGIVVVPLSLVVFYLLLEFYLNLQFAPLFYIAAFAYVFPSFAYGIEIVNLFRLQREKTVVGYLFIGALANTILSGAFLYSGFGMTGALAGSAIAQLIALVLFKSRLHFEK